MKTTTQREQLYSWIDRRTGRGWFSLKAAGSQTFELHKHLGGRSIYGFVALTATPAKTFSFASTASWPADDYTEFVLDGVLDAIFPTLDPILGVSVTLTEIRWHEIDSCAAAYQVAAMEAMKKILDGGRDYLAKRITEPDAAHQRLSARDV